MDKSEFQKIRKIVETILKKAEDEALSEGINIFSEEWSEFLLLLKSQILNEVGLSVEEYDNLIAESKKKAPPSYKTLVDTPVIPQDIDIQKIAEEVAKKTISEFKPDIPAPQIINKVVKEIIREKPITKVFKTKEVVRELDKTATDNLKKDLLALQSSFTDLYDTVRNIKIPDDYISTSVLEPSVMDIVGPELNRALRSIQSQVYMVNKKLDDFLNAGNYIIGDGVAKMTVGTVEPTAPATGDLWVDTT
jgi:hypothetical protein